jgi:hypothetical protein
MQTSGQAQQAATTAQTPAAITIVGADGKPQTLTIPRTRAEVQQLLAQQQELSEQLVNVTSRRRELSEEIRVAPDGASRTGLEERLGVLDKRILQLEADIAGTGRQLASAPAALVESTRNTDPTDDFVPEPFIFAGFFAVLGAVAVMFARRRRFRRRPVTPARLTDDSARLERLEQGMEAIAIEIERVSEGQRFVTRLLAESEGQASQRMPQSVAAKDSR